MHSLPASYFELENESLWNHNGDTNVVLSFAVVLAFKTLFRPARSWAELNKAVLEKPEVPEFVVWPSGPSSCARSAS